MRTMTMAIAGALLGAAAGNVVGRIAGHHLKPYTGIGKKTGGEIGTALGGGLGALLPFRKGGRVGKTGAILAHRGEFVLPKGVNPSTHQIRLVKKGRGKSKSKPSKKRSSKRGAWGKK